MQAQQSSLNCNHSIATQTIWIIYRLVELSTTCSVGVFGKTIDKIICHVRHQQPQERKERGQSGRVKIVFSQMILAVYLQLGNSKTCDN